MSLQQGDSDCFAFVCFLVSGCLFSLLPLGLLGLALGWLDLVWSVNGFGLIPKDCPSVPHINSAMSSFDGFRLVLMISVCETSL